MVLFGAKPIDGAELRLRMVRGGHGNKIVLDHTVGQPQRPESPITVEGIMPSGWMI